ncbi:hypothetical protein [Nocardioides sp.]|uniref:hypothetical protein n=1 Tax=Nocardioides sp. TaxID=35761 RepID=UPI002D7E2DDD|nr:hypothetical protein [Nocardioides sp.]HET8959002.1 hypothetical protein [Nocardioides sp.]
MADRVILHVGTPKAGTTYLQTLLWANRARLAEAGVLLPGARPFEHNQAAAAVRSGWAPRRVTTVWDRLHAEVMDHPGTALLSNEWFALAGPARAREAVARFGEAEVHVVVTARDLVSVVPAGWQETLKLGRGGSLADFISGLEPPGERWGYWTLDPAWVLERWAAGLDPARVHVVTVPTRRDEPDQLWQRFASVVGIADGVVDVSAGARANESLSVESARLLEVLGPRLREAVEADEHMWSGYRWLRRYLSHTLLVPRKGGRIGLSAEQFKTLRKRSRKAAKELVKRGYHVVGDIEELNSVTHDSTLRQPEGIPDREVLEHAADLSADLLRALRETSDSGRPVPDNAEFSERA